MRQRNWKLLCIKLLVMHVVSHAITCDKKRFSTSQVGASDGLRVFANISLLISITGINRGLDCVKCVEVLVRRSSPVRKLASTHISGLIHKRNKVSMCSTRNYSREFNYRCSMYKILFWIRFGRVMSCI